MNFCKNCKYRSVARIRHTDGLLAPINTSIDICTAYNQPEYSFNPVDGKIKQTTFKVREIETEEFTSIHYSGKVFHPYCRSVNKYGLCYKYEFQENNQDENHFMIEILKDMPKEPYGIVVIVAIVLLILYFILGIKNA